MNLSTLARTSLLHLSPLRSTSLTRENATESVAIEGRNINFSVNTRQGKMVPILKDLVSKALDAVSMSEYLQRPVQTLSGGQEQRVAIAGALAEACKALILDEFTTFLDESDQMGVIKAVQNLLDISEVTALWV
uniref:ABC transporter domain-containing protein n=1 Tax=Gossypium raimondii TaxID=29730 RepID=A0A0D2THS7_GOSRA|nr:hypothetical protein B456_012G034800 [Gossypium raimondii]